MEERLNRVIFRRPKWVRRRSGCYGLIWYGNGRAKGTRRGSQADRSELEWIVKR